MQVVLHRLADWVAKNVARVLAPAIGWAGATRAMSAVEAYAAFLIGKGAGSGWDTRAEAKVAARIVRRSNAVIFDVGANDGRWSKAAAQAIGRSAECSFFLFECSPYVLPYLRKNASDIPNATVIEAAVSDNEGTIQLHTPRRGSGLASVYERRDVGITPEEYEIVQVRSITVDNFVKEHRIERIDLLKMDIEGHELSALHGASGCIRNGVIRAVTFEFGSANVNSRTFFRDYFDFFTQAGFVLYRIGAGGVLFAINGYGEDLEYFRGASNYAALLSAEPLSKIATDRIQLIPV